MGQKMKSSISLMLLIISSCLWNLSEQHKPKDCMHQCGNISIPAPFGIGPAHCSKNPNFAVSCNSSSSKTQTPYLKILNLEIVEVRTKTSELIVKIPTVTTCNGTKIHVFPINFTVFHPQSHYYIIPEKHSFVSVGCHGYALLYNKQKQMISGCTSLCAPDGPNSHSTSLSSHHQMDQCYGFNNCCKISFDSNYFDEYTIAVSANNESGHCRSVFLISREYMRTVSSSTGQPWSAAPVVLEWIIEDDSFITRLLWISMGIAAPVILLFSEFGHWWIGTRDRRKEIKLRKKYFKGRLEQQRFNQEEAENTKLYTKRQLQEATDNFNESRIIGKGGQGTVYKGMLPDGTLIAVKKSLSFDNSQSNDFINEVFILSQVNHRNVVKLFGCCLEAKYLFLVYEFVSNGTLHELLHNPSDEFTATWELRLRIASEVAGAIAHLHSTSSTPILHRDIKAMNILLDQAYMAKLCDFGISRNTTTDQTHLSTLVKGTFGYYDPQYFRSKQYTEKSDVFSFGVVLFEILTGQTPIRKMPDGDSVSTVMEFASLTDDSALHEMLDPIVRANNTNNEDIMAVVKIAKRCMNPEGARRPTMMQIALELKRLSDKAVVEESASSIEDDSDLSREFFSAKTHLDESCSL